jgi:hypothetical protein
MNNNRKLYAAGLVAAVIIIGVLFVAAAAKNKPKATPTPTPAEATYTGTENLLARGMSSQQLEDMEFAFYRFFRGQNVKPAEVSISGVDHFHDGNADPTDALTFKADVDSKAYQGKVTYSDIDSIRLYLTDPVTHQQVFDSGVVKVQSED